MNFPKRLITAAFCLISVFLFLTSCDLYEPQDPAIIPEQFQQTGLANIEVNSFFIEGNELFAATDNGVWSTDILQDGIDWNSIGLEGQNVADLVVLPDGSLLAGIRTEEAQSDQPTIYRWNSLSEEWEPYQQNYGGEENMNMIQALEVHPDRHGHVFARGEWHTALSTDSGDNWQVIFGDWDMIGYQAGLLEIDPHDTDRIWIGGENAAFQPYLYRSDNMGNSWEEIEIETGGDDAVYSMAFNPDNQENLLVGMEGKILGTDDMGETWSQVFENHDYHYILAMTTPNNELSETVYASGTENGAQGGNLFYLYTEDFGESWEKISSDQNLQNMAVRDLVVREFGNETTIYFATTNGVWVYRM